MPVRASTLIAVAILILTLFSACNTEVSSPYLEIGGKRLHFEIEERFRVEWLQGDSVLIRGDTVTHTVCGSSRGIQEMRKDEIRPVKIDTVSRDGCVFVEYSSYIIDTADPGPYYYAVFADSNFVVKRPKDCNRQDTICVLSPQTLEEEYVINSDFVVKSDLGEFSREEIKEAINRSFFVSKGMRDLRIDTVYMILTNTGCDEMFIDYKSSTSVKAATEKVDKLPGGSTFIISSIVFSDAKNRVYRRAYDVACFKLAE